MLVLVFKFKFVDKRRLKTHGRGTHDIRCSNCTHGLLDVGLALHSMRRSRPSILEMIRVDHLSEIRGVRARGVQQDGGAREATCFLAKYTNSAGLKSD